MTIQPLRVAAVVVTYNRLALLQECIAALRAQTHRPDEIIVVDNASTDGTGAWLDEQGDLTVFHQGNLGSSGGQHRGIKEGYNRGHDWFWLMDDDTIPDPDCLEQMLGCEVANDSDTGFLCSVVRWIDGSLHKMNGPNVYRSYDSLMELFPKGLLRVTHASFVSCLVHRRAVAAVGLPLKEMFVWYDDAEYTKRISDRFPSYQVLSSKAEHRSRTNYVVNFSDMSGLPVAYLMYGLRNYMLFSQLETGPGLPRIRRKLSNARQLTTQVMRQFHGKERHQLLRAIGHGFFFSPRPEMPTDE